MRGKGGKRRVAKMPVIGGKSGYRGRGNSTLDIEEPKRKKILYVVCFSHMA